MQAQISASISRSAQVASGCMTGCATPAPGASWATRGQRDLLTGDLTKAVEHNRQPCLACCVTGEMARERRDELAVIEP